MGSVSRANLGGCPPSGSIEVMLESRPGSSKLRTPNVTKVVVVVIAVS